MGKAFPSASQGTDTLRSHFILNVYRNRSTLGVIDLQSICLREQVEELTKMGHIRKLATKDDQHVIRVLQDGTRHSNDEGVANITIMFDHGLKNIRYNEEQIW